MLEVTKTSLVINNQRVDSGVVEQSNFYCTHSAVEGRDMETRKEFTLVIQTPRDALSWYPSLVL